MEIKNLNEVPAFTTKDGSEIRELLAHRNSGIRNQSLAEARLPVGGSTQEHFHPRAEEIYYITHGTGRIRIEAETRAVRPGTPSPSRRACGTSCGTRARNRCACCAVARRRTSTTTRSSPKSKLTSGRRVI